jgi:chlorite dismutase
MNPTKAPTPVVTTPTPAPARPAPVALRRQFVSFYGLKVAPAWRALDPAAKARGREGFIAACEAFRAEGGILVPYSCVGVRGDVDIMLWRIHQDLEPLQRHGAALMKSPMGPYLETPYALLGMTKRSTYVDHIHPEHEDERLTIVPGTQKYIFVYPFVKTREWYALDGETRQKMMREHIHIGTTYPSVKLNTTYSFGLDDQEFVVAFESDRADDFLDLVQDLRETAASRYTLRDTPTFTCVRGSFEAVLDTLG